MTERAVVIDFDKARLDRLRRMVLPIGVEVRCVGFRYALRGSDRGLYLHPGGVSRAVRWLSYDEATASLGAHLAAPTVPTVRR